jgi:hypothetical protein
VLDHLARHADVVVGLIDVVAGGAADQDARAADGRIMGLPGSISHSYFLTISATQACQRSHTALPSAILSQRQALFLGLVHAADEEAAREKAIEQFKVRPEEENLRAYSAHMSPEPT